MAHRPGKLGSYHNKLMKAVTMNLKRIETLEKGDKQGWSKRNSESWNVLGVQRTLADDFQHICLELEWAPLMCLVLVVYSAVSLAFAVGFYALLRVYGEQHLLGERVFESMFEECLWMSVGNLVTVGYGGLLPASRTAFVLATLEHFVGILLSAILLGVVVTKASLPESRIVFSDKVVFTRRNGAPTVLFRVGNTRGHFLLNPEVRVSYFRPVKTSEGENIWVSSRLEVEEPPQLAPAFNLTHTVTKDSPLFGMTQGQYQSVGGDLAVTVGAVDDHSLQTIYARKLYLAENVEFNVRFGDVLVKGEDGSRTVDFRKFNNVIAVDDDLSEWVGK